MRNGTLRRGGSAEFDGFLSALLSLGVLLAGGEHAAAQQAVSARPEPSVEVLLITATRGERDVLEIAGDASVIDRAAIERAGVATIPDLLRRQPGLFVTSFTTNPAGVTVEARGFNNGGSLGSSLLVLLDGRRMNEADTGNTDWALIPLDRVDRIEIVQGSASAIYGDNAVGGVINIRTRPYDGPRATTRGRVGRYGSGGGSLDAQLGSGPVSGGVFLNGFTTDGYRDRSDYDDRNFQGDLQWAVGDGVEVGARGGYHRDHRSLPGALSAMELRILGPTAADPDNTRDESEVEYGFVQGWLEARLAEDVSFSLAPSYRRRTDETRITSIAFGPPTTFTIDTHKSSVGVDLEVQSDRRLAGLENRLIGGAEFLYEETDRDIASSFGTTISDNQRLVSAAFVQDEVWLADSILFSAGVRFDYARYELVKKDASARDEDEPSFNLWSPRASVTLRLRPDVSAYASYSRGFRLPNFDENAPLIGFAVPDLAPQISDTFELGLKQRGERLAGSLSLYWMEVKDEILYDPFTFANSNLDRVRHRGLTASASADFFDGLSVYASYTFDDVTVLEADDPLIQGERMPITPLHRGTAGLFFELPHQVELTANVNVVGERILSNAFDRKLDPLDSYAVVDLLAAWRPQFGDHWEGALTLALRNVADEEYSDFGARYDVGFPSAVPSAFFNPAAGRSWELGVSLAWSH